MAVRTDKIRSFIVDTVRQEVSAVTPNNDLVSRKEEELLAPELQRAAHYARAKKPAGSTITTEEVVASYADYFDQVNSAVNTRGPQWLSDKETASVRNNALQVRIVQARAHLESDSPFALDAAMSREERLTCMRDHGVRRNPIRWQTQLFDQRYPPERTADKVLMAKIEELRSWAAENLYADEIAAGRTVDEAFYDDLGGISLEGIADDRGRLLGYELTLTHNQGEMGTTYFFDKWGVALGEESADV